MRSLSLPQLHEPPPPDNCGPCNVCCDVVGVVELGKPYYARCPHLRPESQTGGCGIYPIRPQPCAAYRCAWHMGILGPRTDRRPLECGVMFQFEQEKAGWRLSAFETRPGSLLTDKTMFLIRQILTSKKTRHLKLLPEVYLTPYGADVFVAYPISDIYAYKPPPVVNPMRPYGQMELWDGAVRELLMPKS